MPLPTIEELEEKYGHLIDDPIVRGVARARTRNEAEPVDEEAIWKFAEETADEHYEYVDRVLSNMKNADD